MGSRSSTRLTGAGGIRSGLSGTSNTSGDSRDAARSFFQQEVRGEILSLLAGATRGESVTARYTNGVLTVRTASHSATYKRDTNGNYVISRVRGTTRGFAKNLAALQALGVSRVSFRATRQNGTHYRAALLGFDGAIPRTVRSRLPQELQGARNVSDLMRTPAGRSFWRTQGRGGVYSFDLSRRSPSVRRLNGFLRSRREL